MAASEQANHALVGLAVGVAPRGEVVFIKGYGFEDREAQIPVDPHTTQFRWASLSKTLTAVLLEQLARERLVEWTAETTRYVPAYVPRTYLDRAVADGDRQARPAAPALAVEHEVLAVGDERR